MTTQPILLLVSDEAAIRGEITLVLVPDYQVIEAVDRETAMSRILQLMPPLVLPDLSRPSSMEGTFESLMILRATLLLYPSTKMIIVMPNNDRANGIAAFESGAHDV